MKRYVWQCSKKYKVKGEIGCDNDHVDERDLYEAFGQMVNKLLENREDSIIRLREQIKSEDSLLTYKSEQLINVLELNILYQEFSLELFRLMVEKLLVMDRNIIVVYMFEGTSIEN